MIIHLLNKTGKILSVHTSNTKYIKNIESKEGEFSLYPYDKYYTFSCNKPYAIIKTIDHITHLYDICIIPMPISGMNEIYLVMGLNENNIIHFSDGSLDVNEFNKCKELNTLHIGMGKYFIFGSNYEIMEDIIYYRPNHIKYIANKLYCNLIAVDNIRTYMNAPPEITDVERLQIYFILGIILFIVVLIISLTVYGYNVVKIGNLIY